MTEQTHTVRRLLPLASDASGGCACCAPADASAARAVRPEASAVAAASATYQVEGMTCGHCAGRVTDALAALDDVDDVHVELGAGGTSAVVVTGPAAPRAVRDAVAEAGYTVVVS